MLAFLQKKVLLEVFIGCQLSGWCSCLVAADVACEKRASWCVCCDLPQPELCFPSSFPKQMKFWSRVCFLQQETSSNEVNPVSWNGDVSVPWWWVRTLLGWCHKLTWLDCREQILLTEESRHVLSVIWIWKSALNSEIVAFKMSCKGLMLHCPYSQCRFDYVELSPNHKSLF